MTIQLLTTSEVSQFLQKTWVVSPAPQTFPATNTAANQHEAEISTYYPQMGSKFEIFEISGGTQTKNLQIVFENPKPGNHALLESLILTPISSTAYISDIKQLDGGKELQFWSILINILGHESMYSEATFKFSNGKVLKKPWSCFRCA